MDKVIIHGYEAQLRRLQHFISSWPQTIQFDRGIVLCYVYDGACRLASERTEVMLKTGESFIMQSHEFICTPAGECNCYFASLSVEPIPPNIPTVPIRTASGVLYRLLWEKLEKDCNEHNGETALLWLGPIMLMTYRPDVHANSSQGIERLCAEIEANPHQNFSLEQLCTMSGYSANHLIRLFKNHTGVSPHEYITNLKIERAKDMILSGMSVTKIAQQLNYYDANHFSKQFKKKTGLTPRAFARQYAQPAQK